MRTRLSYLPFLIAASVACQGTDPSVHTDAVADSATQEPSDLFTSSVATPATEGDGFALAANVVAQEGDAAAADDSDESINKALLRMQKSKALSEQFAARAEEALSRSDLQGALVLYSEAVQLDPSNQAAREGFRRVEGMMGDPLAQGSAAFESEADRYLVKQTITRARAEEWNAKGDAALRAGDYDGAVEAYRQAETILRIDPLIATDSLDERIVSAKLKETIQLRDEAEQLELAQARAAAAEEAARKEAAERDRVRNKLSTYYESANSAFMAENYDEAAKFAQLILVADPGNENAQELLEVSRAAGHAKVDERLRRDYREEWLRTFDDLRTMDVPQTQPLVFDLDRWKEVSQRKSFSSIQIEAADDPERAKVIERLDQTIVPARFGDEDGPAALASVAKYLQAQSGVNFQVSSLVYDEIGEDEVAVDLDVSERSVTQILDMIALLTEGMSWKVEDGVVLFVTDGEMTGGQVSATYSVADLVTPIPDYPAPDINIAPSDGLPIPDEDLPERESNVIGTGELEELIMNNIAPDSWGDDPANSIRVTEKGTLVVSQTPAVQAKIKNLLDDLRESTGILVDIQARFMRVEDSFLEDIGVDFRGLGLPGPGPNGVEFNDFGDGSSEFGDVIGRTSDVGAYFDDGEDGSFRARVEDLYDSQLGSDTFKASGGLSFQWAFLNDLQLELILRAVSKSERMETVTAPRLLVNNGARANISVLNQVAYVQDFDVQIAQAASIADPIINVIQDGVVLDVRPVVSADRRFITLELRPTIATLKRPIRDQPTTLGTQNSVTIQLPEVSIERVRTSIPIPDGGTVLLGGLKESSKQDKRSGVPFLNKVPLLNFLFERKGNFVSNRKLLILLNGEIVIPKEDAPTDAELGRDF
ncbi:MAG: hypothetical protein PVJ89_11330 [Planctomycetota bacterium]|jgi:tetratricopeptide (TPR) repeat protein